MTSDPAGTSLSRRSNVPLMDVALERLLGVTDVRQRKALERHARCLLEPLDLDAVVSQLALDLFVQPVGRRGDDVFSRDTP